MGTVGSPKLLRFGIFEADLRTGELRKAGRRIRIQEQPFKVLAMLLGRPGEMLSREELRDRIWSADTFVDFDTGLNKAIRKVREVLGDSAESPTFIETLPRRGYRFIAPVEVVTLDTGVAPPHAAPGQARAIEQPPAGESDKAHELPARASKGFRAWLLLTAALGLAGLGIWVWRARSHSQPAFDAIAVLPLENLSDQPGQEYFADGITDQLITELAKIGSLRVTSRTSVMRYRHSNKPLPEIARELGVNVIVEGTVLRSGGRIRVTAQLIDAARDQHIWAQSYEQSMGDVLALQSRLTQDIAAHVNARLTGDERQMLAANRFVDPEAYIDYLKGRFFWNKRTDEDAYEAIRYFKSAIDRQPDYAEAYAGIAEAYVVLGWDRAIMPPDEAFPKARAAALKALEIDRSSSAAHVALMWVELFSDWNWTEAEREAKEAIRLSPSSVIAHHHYSRLLSFAGRFDEALEESRQSVRLDPLDPIAAGGVSWNNYLARRYEPSIQQSLQMIRMYPSMPGYYRFLGWCYEAEGRFREAIQAFQQALERGDSTMAIADLAYAYGVSGDQQAARSTIAKLTALSRQQYVPRYYFAVAFAGLRDSSQAFDWLEQAFREHSPFLVFLKTDPKLDPLRTDPRFPDMLRRVGFPNGR
jgi:TolB-like protein/DNA-binding winged helix-turn-helix (wHTH) protein/Flp pilus assembly protein TadD